MARTHKHTHRSGVTLTEMTVVLALISIVSLVVISFTTMVHTRSLTAATKNRVADDVRVSKMVLNNWINSISAIPDATLMVSGDGNGLVALIGDHQYSATLTEGALVATLPNGETLSCPVGEVSSFSFDMLARMDGIVMRDVVWLCTAHYELPTHDKIPVQQEITFSINPHVGDVLP